MGIGTSGLALKHLDKLSLGFLETKDLLLSTVFSSSEAVVNLCTWMRSVRNK